MAGLYAALGALDFCRVRVMSRVGVQIDDDLREKVFSAVQVVPLRMRHSGDGLEPVRDLDRIRTFLSGLGPAAFFYLPWIPIYLAVVFLLHPMLGLFALAGALAPLSLTLFTKAKSAGPLEAAARSGSRRLPLGEAAPRHPPLLPPLGPPPP